MKIAQNKEIAWQIQETYKDEPHGFIQWKGTNVCMDVYCKCGTHFHIDSDFAYYVKCPKCKKIYMCNSHIELIQIDEEPESCVVTDENYIDEDI